MPVFYTYAAPLELGSMNRSQEVHAEILEINRGVHPIEADDFAPSPLRHRFKNLSLMQNCAANGEGSSAD